jgi:catechol 2,3-dioxygenase-like lactoylglutathione lyase family enzyme
MLARAVRYLGIMTEHDVAIAHVTLEVRRPDRWRRFLADLTDGQARVVWDDSTRGHALRLREGRADDLVLLGLAYPDEDRLAAVTRNLTAAGVLWEQVPGGIRCVDPAGTPLELLVNDDTTPERGWPLGHVALTHRDQPALAAFYSDVLGLRCNEVIEKPAGPIELRASFLGGARRHHTVAVMNVPSRRRLHHVCFAARDVATVEVTWQQALAARVPISMELGQHALPDGTTSFYAASPSGIDVEIGAGGNVLDGVTPAPLHGTETSSWGHAMRLRAKLRVAGALALQRLGLAS